MSAVEHQTHWRELCRDPNLNDLPHKTETNYRGQLVLTPPSNNRSRWMKSVMDALDECALEGVSLPSLPVATPEGVKVPDVAWASDERLEEMEEAGDPPTTASEICVEVMSVFNDWGEMHAKRDLYRKAGAEEVWIVTEEGDVRFFADEELQASGIAKEFPGEL